jgi:quercetin dioxygenase-like cupin family protein
MQFKCVKLPGPYATIYVANAPGDCVAEHTHEYLHSCTVVVGAARVVCGGKESVLSEGQSVVFPAGIPHSIHPLAVGTVFVNASASILPSEEDMFSHAAGDEMPVSS